MKHVIEFVKKHPWQVIGAAALIVIAVAVVGALAANRSDTSAAPATSESATVLEIGAMSGPAGDAMLYIRQEALAPTLDVQWLQFGDIDGMLGGLGVGTGMAAIVPADASLPDGVTVVSKLITVDVDGAPVSYVLVATDASRATNQAAFEALTDAIRSDQVLAYLASAGHTAARS